MFYFCTYFDSNYLIKGLALYRSLVRHAAPFRLWVLCFDNRAYEILRKLAFPEVIPIALEDFEEGDEALLQAKGDRSRIEYYFTCTPSLPLYIFKHHPEVGIVSYLDADLFFFSNPSSIYQELNDESILIIGHRFPPHLEHLEARGVYNVGLLSFRRDDVGLECLHWWRQWCLEWCYDRVEDGRYADQKYLDDWPTRFPRTVVLQHLGAGLAPWNASNYSLRIGENGQILVDSQPLVFFHFHGAKQIHRYLFDPALGRYGIHSNNVLKRQVYALYLQELQDITLWLSEYIAQSYIEMASIRSGNSKPVSCSRAMARKIKRLFIVTRKILQGEIWVVITGRIL